MYVYTLGSWLTARHVIHRRAAGRLADQMSSPGEYLPVRVGLAFGIAPCGELSGQKSLVQCSKILAPECPAISLANRQGRSSAWSASASRAPGIYVYVCACTPTMACRLQGTYSCTPGVKTNISNGSRIKLGIKSCYYAPACVRQLCAGVERTPSSSRAPMRCRTAGLRSTHVPCPQGEHRP